MADTNPRADDAFPLDEWLAPGDVEAVERRRPEPEHESGSSAPQESGPPQHDDSLDRAPMAPTLWRVLFDPANTSQLYSAPQRFDLATIFVVTAAYSILFGGLSLLDGYWASLGAGVAPVVKIVLGSIITLVGLSQALLRGIVNPRGTSIVVGAAGYMLFCVGIGIVNPWRLPDPLVALVVFNGPFVGAAIGYISGVLVGGVFLAADALRGMLECTDATPREETLETGSVAKVSGKPTCKS